MARQVALALLALGLGACGLSGQQISVCHVRAANIDHAYFLELVASCRGYELEVCPSRDEIEARYTVMYEQAAKDCGK